MPSVSPAVRDRTMDSVYRDNRTMLVCTGQPPLPSLTIKLDHWKANWKAVSTNH